MVTFEALLESLTGDLAPVGRRVRRLIDAEGYPNQTDPDRFALHARPRLGPNAFAVSLYPPLGEEVISRYERIHGFQIPTKYRAILVRVNGFDIFKIWLGGVFPSMAEDPPLLDRSRCGPGDLSLANRSWIKEYSLKEPLFHFGGRRYSSAENLGYFLDPEQHVVAYRKNGELIQSWNSFSAFLDEELSRAEESFPEFEEAMAQIRAAHYAKQRQKP